MTKMRGIKDTDGKSPVAFWEVESGNYYLAVLHNNHLAIMSKMPIDFK